MKNKKIIWLFLITVVIILVAGYFGINYVKNKTEQSMEEEFVPGKEITDEQMRQTIVSLYFVNKETGELMPEARLVDIKEIINLPYEKLMALLIEGPKNDKLRKIIPEGTKVLKSYRETDCLVLDLSREFLDYDKSKEKKNEKEMMIQCVVKTMTELTEINQVKFLIDGKENEEFKEAYVREIEKKN